MENTGIWKERKIKINPKTIPKLKNHPVELESMLSSFIKKSAGKIGKKILENQSIKGKCNDQNVKNRIAKNKLLLEAILVSFYKITIAQKISKTNCKKNKLQEIS